MHLEVLSPLHASSILNSLGDIVYEPLALQGLVVLNYPSYIFECWHITLIMWLVVLISIGQNVWRIKLLPAFELFSGCTHIFLSVALAIGMLVMGKNAIAEFVFTEFVNEMGWDKGVAWFLDCYLVFGVSSAHTIPKVIMTTVLVNGSIAWIFVLLCLFSISGIDAVLSTPTGYPLIEIMRQLTRTRKGATVIYSLILAITIAAMFGTLASVSRLTWAFARDDELPFSRCFKHVDGKYKIPTWSITLVSVVIVMLSLIRIGHYLSLFLHKTE